MPKKPKPPSDEQLVMQVQIAAGALVSTIEDARKAGLIINFIGTTPDRQTLKIVSVTRNIPVPKDGAAP